MSRADYNIVKEYPRQGKLQQFRLAETTAFHCERCGQDKKSKLIAVRDGDWAHLYCNGCYGWLLANGEGAKR